MQRKKPKGKATPSSLVTVDREAVIKLAYELYLQRGGQQGSDVEDWLLAEQILIEQRRQSSTRRRVSDAARRMEDKFHSR